MQEQTFSEEMYEAFNETDNGLNYFLEDLRKNFMKHEKSDDVRDVYTKTKYERFMKWAGNTGLLD